MIFGADRKTRLTCSDSCRQNHHREDVRLRWHTNVNILLSLMRGVWVKFKQRNEVEHQAWRERWKRERDARIAKGDKRYLVNQVAQ